MADNIAKYNQRIADMKMLHEWHGMNLPTRLINAFLEDGISTFSEAAAVAADQKYLRKPNIGPKSIKQLRDEIKRVGGGSIDGAGWAEAAFDA